MVDKVIKDNYWVAMSATQIIEMIANDYVELSYDKIVWQRDDYIRMCREWLKAHPKDEE
jgi:hypothetical protein